jgi:hypothetical protein
VSVLVSGLLGLLSFQALSLVVYVIGRDALVSIGAAFVVFLGRAADFGVVYPIALVGTQHTYGVVGLGWVVLVAALFGAGRPKAGGFLLGLAPAVHPALGLWIGLLLGGTAILGWRRAWADYRAGWIWFLAGGACTALSLAVHLLTMPSLPQADPAAAARYLQAYVSFWDGHRAPVDFTHPGIAINAAIVVGAIIWILRGARGLTTPQTFFLRFIAVAGAASLALAGLSHLPPDTIPATLLVLMPSRLLNINVMIGAALLLGAVGRRTDVPSRLALAAIAAAVLLSGRSWLWRVFEPGVGRTVADVGVAGFVSLAIAGMALATWATDRFGSRGDPTAGMWASRVARALTGGLMVMAVVLAFLVAIERRDVERDWILKDRTNERIFGLAAESPGLILTGGDLHLIQLRSRRPVLLDSGALDTAIYAPAAGPAVARLLQDVYGIDLFNPPAEARGKGAVPLEANRVVWESYSPARWREIAGTYGVTQVFTPGLWKLELPLVAAGQGMLLYRIPR